MTRKMREYGPNSIYWHIAVYLRATIPTIKFGEAFKDKVEAHARYLKAKDAI